MLIISVNYIYYTTREYLCKLFKEKTQANLFRNSLLRTKKEKAKSLIIKKVEIRDQITNNAQLIGPPPKISKITKIKI